MFTSQMKEMGVDLLFSKQHYDDLDYIKNEWTTTNFLHKWKWRKKLNR